MGLALSYTSHLQRISLPAMSSNLPSPNLLPRRNALGRMALGFGGLALNTLLAEQSQGASPLRPQALFPARARRVIFLFMHGGPSHVDLSLIHI